MDHEPMGVAEAGRGTALVADDEPANCRLLEAMLRREGFAVISVSNGEEAVRQFQASRPDIVLMDVMMPVMNGYQATREIKALSGDVFTPVIFLTALKDSESLVRCTESGGDDFLSKPFDFEIFKARIRAMERVRDLHRDLAQKHDHMQRLQEDLIRDHHLAERIFSKAISERNSLDPRIHTLQRAASTFCGDLVLTTTLPDGGFRVLAGDFTGHGLAAAIGALPVSEIFHSMSQDGASDQELIMELNHRLHSLLPPELFMAACLLSCPRGCRSMRLWNGGMPPAWLISKGELTAFASQSLPLGVIPDLGTTAIPERLATETGDRILMISDGLPEAEDHRGWMLGEQAIRGSLLGSNPLASSLEALEKLLDEHTGGQRQRDDITVVEVTVGEDGTALPTRSECEHRHSWDWHVTLRNEQLRNMPDLEKSLQAIDVLESIAPELGAVRTIVSELYNNALDHGILKLQSGMKSAPEGFEEYYLIREARLNAEICGSISIDIEHRRCQEQAYVAVTVTDSGPGFDHREWEDEATSENVPFPRPWGRGIAMIRGLCQSLSYYGRGNRVTAIYSYDQPGDGASREKPEHKDQ